MFPSVASKSSRKRSTSISSSGGGGDVSSVGMNVVPNIQINSSVSGNALTISVKTSAGVDASSGSPIATIFRDTTLTSGATLSRNIQSALSLTVPSGQVVGTVNNVPFRFWVLAIDNAGTVELAIQNCTIGGATPSKVVGIDETSLVSTTAIASAPSAGVMYSATARSNVAVRILGYVEYSSGLATAGTYASAPTKVQLFGPGIRRPGEIFNPSFGYSSTQVSTTGTTYVDTGVSASITPFSPANLVIVNYTIADVYTPNTGTSVTLRTLRNSTQVSIQAGATSYNSAGASITSGTGGVMDAPGLTSTITYKVQFARTVTAGTVVVQNNGANSFMSLYEVMG